MIKERIKKNTFALQGLQGYTRIHNIKPNHDWRFNDLGFRGLQDIVKSWWKVKKVTKTENLRKCFVLYFGVWRKREKVCELSVQLFAISSVVLLRIHNLQTITPKSFNHTTYKPSYHNHTILEIFFDRSVWKLGARISSKDE